jgi:hypothetical protein
LSLPGRIDVQQRRVAAVHLERSAIVDQAFRIYVAPADATAPTSTAAAEPVGQGQPPIAVTATATFKTTMGATVGTVGPVQCWNSRSVRVTLDATDNPGGSGVATLTYWASGAQPIPSTTVPAAALPATVTITAPGVTTLSYQATDNAGNQEQPGGETVLVGPSNRPPFACALPTPESFTIPRPRLGDRHRNRHHRQPHLPLQHHHQILSPGRRPGKPAAARRPRRAAPRPGAARPFRGCRRPGGLDCGGR